MALTLSLLRELYNAALEERIRARKAGRKLSVWDQKRELVEVRAVRPEYAAIHSHLLQNAIGRLDRSFRAFFTRCQIGAPRGYPRFKGKRRYNSFTFPDVVNNNGAKIVAGGKRVRLTGIGNVKVKLHRPIDGVARQATVSRRGDGHWYVTFTCDSPRPAPAEKVLDSVGIDVGVASFAALSNGETIANPRWFERAQNKLATAQRTAARRKRGSKRWSSAVDAVRRQHDRVRRTRLDFHHKTAAGIVGRFGIITVESLNVHGMGRGRLAKQIHDAAWAKFISILASKAESAGREFIKVDPRGTSQECSGCGAKVPKSLGVRVHSCPHCGLVLDRDVNAAKNILSRGHRDRGGVSCKRLDEPRSPTDASDGI